MPIYEYQCTSCGKQLEAFQKITEEPLTECPTCHKNALNKLISSTSFQLKGTGWYATDFRNKDKPKAEKSNESTDSSSSGTKTKKSDDSTSSGSTSSNQ